MTFMTGRVPPVAQKGFATNDAYDAAGRHRFPPGVYPPLDGTPDSDNSNEAWGQSDGDPDAGVTRAITASGSPGSPPPAPVFAEQPVGGPDAGQFDWWSEPATPQAAGPTHDYWQQGAAAEQTGGEQEWDPFLLRQAAPEQPVEHGVGVADRADVTQPHGIAGLAEHHGYPPPHQSMYAAPDRGVGYPDQGLAEAPYAVPDSAGYPQQAYYTAPDQAAGYGEQGLAEAPYAQQGFYPAQDQDAAYQQGAYGHDPYQQGGYAPDGAGQAQSVPDLWGEPQRTADPRDWDDLDGLDSGREATWPVRGWEADEHEPEYESEVVPRRERAALEQAARRRPRSATLLIGAAVAAVLLLIPAVYLQWPDGDLAANATQPPIGVPSFNPQPTTPTVVSPPVIAVDPTTLPEMTPTPAPVEPTLGGNNPAPRPSRTTRRPAPPVQPPPTRPATTPPAQPSPSTSPTPTQPPPTTPPVTPTPSASGTFGGS